MLAEREGVTATCLGQRPSGGGRYLLSHSLKIIHRAPSVERVTATCLGNHNLSKQHKKCKYEFERTLQMSYLIAVTKQTKRIAHGA